MSDQNLDKTVAILSQQVDAFGGFASVRVRKLSSVNANQIDHHKLLAVVGFKESSYNLGVAVFAHFETADLIHEIVHFLGAQRASPVVVPKAKNNIQA